MTSSDIDVERDCVYFLGELSRATVPDDILALVERRLDESRPVGIVRAAVWCWGRLADADRASGMTALKGLARRHPSELVREEAITAIWRASGGWFSEDVAAALTTDGAGRVRFAAAECARASADHDPEAVKVLRHLPADPDFGVEFERSSVVGDGVRY